MWCLTTAIAYGVATVLHAVAVAVAAHCSCLPDDVPCQMLSLADTVKATNMIRSVAALCVLQKFVLSGWSIPVAVLAYLLFLASLIKTLSYQ